SALGAAALELIVLTCVTFAWRLTFLPRVAWLSWLVVFAVLVGCNALAWPTQPRGGLVTSLMTLVGMPLASVLALRQRRRSAAAIPSCGNLVMSVTAGILAVVAGLFLAWLPVEYLHWPLHPALKTTDPETLLGAAVDLKAAEWPLAGFTWTELERWCWPGVWITLPLMLLGLWRTVSRGWKESARNRAPLAWTLTVYAVVAMVGVALHPAEVRQSDFLPLASLAVLLAVFCVADLVRGITERLVLPTPEERAEG